MLDLANIFNTLTVLFAAGHFPDSHVYTIHWLGEYLEHTCPGDAPRVFLTQFVSYRNRRLVPVRALSTKSLGSHRCNSMGD